MNSKICKMSALTLAMGAAVAVSGNASASANPFAMQELSSSALQVASQGKCGASKAEAKCGANKSREGKCGANKSEGKCGANKAGKSISVLEGKCGSGKCGATRVREMMDKNGDGRISRDEYVGWVNRQAAADFDKMAHGGTSVSPDDAFKAFQQWERDAEKG